MKLRFDLQKGKRFLYCALLLLICTGMLFSCVFFNSSQRQDDSSEKPEGEDAPMTEDTKTDGITEPVTPDDCKDTATGEHTTTEGSASTTAPEENNPPVPPPSDAAIKIACVGDSLTYGGGLTKPTAYPSVLQRLLGTENYLVKNFGASGRTMTLGLSDATYADRSYADTVIYQESLAFSPDIVVLCLGTNDTWAVDLSTKVGKDGYVAGLTYLLNSYKAIGVEQIYVCLPPYAKSASIGQKVRDLVIPIVLENAESMGYQTIDFFTPTNGKDDWFYDNLHFDPIGYEALANAAYQKLTSSENNPPPNGLPYVSEGFGDVLPWNKN